MSTTPVANQLASPADFRPAATAAPPVPPLLKACDALEALRQRTGVLVSRKTFYRWLENGSIYSLRLGYRIYVPQPALDDFVRKCLQGEGAVSHR